MLANKDKQLTLANMADTADISEAKYEYLLKKLKQDKRTVFWGTF